MMPQLPIDMDRIGKLKLYRMQLRSGRNVAFIWDVDLFSAIARYMTEFYVGLIPEFCWVAELDGNEANLYQWKVVAWDVSTN